MNPIHCGLPRPAFLPLLGGLVVAVCLSQPISSPAPEGRPPRPGHPAYPGGGHRPGGGYHPGIGHHPGSGHRPGWRPPHYGHYSYGPGYFPYFNYGPLVYHYQRLPDRPFPFETPRIYVVPPKQAQPFDPSSPGARRIIVYRMADDVGDAPDYWQSPQPVQYLSAEDVPPVVPVTGADAWQALEAGNYQEALDAFGTLAREKPDQASYKVGFGLAAAFAGDKISARHGLQTGLVADPYCVRDIPTTEGLTAKLTGLSEHYAQAMGNGSVDTGLIYLHAATAHLAGQNETARASLARIASEEDTPPVAALRKAVTWRLAQP